MTTNWSDQLPKGPYVLCVGASQTLYGEENLKLVARNMGTITDKLNKSKITPYKVVCAGVLTDKAGIRRFVNLVNSDDNCMGVIIHSHTFSPGQMWVPLQNLNKPLLHLWTYFWDQLPLEKVDMDFMNTNQSTHGDPELNNGLVEFGIAHHTVCGSWNNAGTLKEIAQWMRVARASQKIMDTRILYFGGRMDSVVGTEMPSNTLARLFGVDVMNMPVSAFAGAMQKVGADAAAALVKQYRKEYAWHTTAEASAAVVSMAATQEIAITELLKRHGASCWTSHFMRLDGMGQLPGLAAQRTMAAGYGFGPEGDVGVALAGLMAHYLSEGVEGAVSTLAEPYLYDGLGDADGGCIVAAHMAEVSPAIADATGAKKPSLQVHKLDIGNSGIVARLVFPGRSGPASLASFVFRNGAPRLIVADVEAVPSKVMKNLPVGHVTLKPLNGVRQFSLQWAAAAGSHHDALAYGLPSADWALFAKINGIPFVKIGS